ncbi:MAG TPA: hypothetical protein VEI02_11770 [Planctomycetota bacterium]|nr:hypothetical protein [Planctomycetota bacterium]
MKTATCVLGVLLATALGGCGDHDHPHPHPHSESPAPQAPASGHHSGKVIDLGTASAGPFHLHVTRDEAPLKEGGVAPVDVRVTPHAGVTAVRLWIGAADGAGALKVKAEIEDAKEPNRFHNHVEVPQPLPADAKLYVELEAAGARHVAGFDLKR